MSKEKSKVPILDHAKMEWSGWGNPHLLFEDSMSRLVGRLLTHIEACGMSASQEKALKTIIKNEVYATLNDAWVVGDADHAMLRKKAYDFGQLSMGGHSPREFPIQMGHSLAE